MAQTKVTFHHKVYWKSQVEYERVRARAAMRGLENNISAHIRDCVIMEMNQAGFVMQAQAPPPPQTNQPLIPLDQIPQDLDLSIPEDEPIDYMKLLDFEEKEEEKD